MERNLVSRVIKIQFNVGSLNPSDFTEERLKELGIVDNNNELDRGMLRIGSLGTNFVFANESQDEIKIQPTMIEIQSFEIERIDLILKGVAKVYKFISSKNIEYAQDEHLDDETYPDSIFNQYVKTTGLNLDAVRFKKDIFSITMLSCGRNRIHLKIISANNKGIMLSKLDWKSYIKYDELTDLYKEFLQNDLNLKKTNV